MTQDIVKIQLYIMWLFFNSIDTRHCEDTAIHYLFVLWQYWHETLWRYCYTLSVCSLTVLTQDSYTLYVCSLTVLTREIVKIQLYVMCLFFNSVDTRHCEDTAIEMMNLNHRLMDLGGHTLHTLTPGLLALVEKCLGKRVSLLQLQQQPVKSVSSIHFCNPFNTEWTPTLSGLFHPLYWVNLTHL